jgi:hypothetical protein
VRFEHKLELSGEEADIVVTDGVWKQQSELLPEAGLQDLLTLVKDLLDFYEVDDGREVCHASS